MLLLKRRRSVVCNTPASFAQHNSQGSCHHWQLDWQLLVET